MSQSRQVGPKVRRPAPPPKEANDRVVTAIGTACWAIALAVLLIFRSALPANAHWWLWTCTAGVVLGLFAQWYVPFLKTRREGVATRHAKAGALSEPALSEPALSEPALSEPALSEPALSEPGLAVPPEPGYSSRDSGSNTVSSTDTPGSSTMS